MPSRTEYLGKLFGWYCVIAAIYAALHKPAFVELAAKVVHNQLLAFVAGAVALVCGLAMVLAHNVWWGGALPVVVTLLGWTNLLKGLLFLFLPTETAAAFFLGTLHYEQWFYGYVAFNFLLGAYLVIGSTISAGAGSGHSRIEIIFGSRGIKTKAEISRVA